MSKFELWLFKRFPNKELGWSEIGEEFTRFALLKSKWFNIYLHRLSCPIWPPKCHNHPWSFLTILLKKGYIEQVGNTRTHHRPGTILWRSSRHTHSVITPFGISWSLIITGPKSHDWRFKDCEE